MTSIPTTVQQLASHGVAYATQIAQAAARHGLDPSLLAAVAAQETGGPGSNAARNIVGDGGHGRGLFQIDDRWHEFARSGRAMDPAANADYAASMISGLLKRFGGNLHKALSAYNAGDPNARGTTTTWADGSVVGYADSVLRHYSALGKISALESDPAEEARAAGPDTFSAVNGLRTFARASAAFGATSAPRDLAVADYASVIDGSDLS